MSRSISDRAKAEGYWPIAFLDPLRQAANPAMADLLLVGHG
jgi:hypothetical protein